MMKRILIKYRCVIIGVLIPGGCGDVNEQFAWLVFFQSVVVGVFTTAVNLRISDGVN
jgi:hypothetical protein